MTNFLTLHGKAVSLVLELPDGEAPLWRYWGLRLPDDVAPPPLRVSRPTPSFSLDFDQPLSICPGLGVGWFGESALLAHRQGADWTFQATSCVVEDAGQTAVVRLTDDGAKIAVSITLNLDAGSDVLTVSTTLTNLGDATLDVQWLASGVVPLPSDAREVRSFGGRHNEEFVPITDQLTRSTWRRENRRGLTSHDCFPGAIVEAAARLMAHSSRGLAIMHSASIGSPPANCVWPLVRALQRLKRWRRAAPTPMLWRRISMPQFVSG